MATPATASGAPSALPAEPFTGRTLATWFSYEHRILGCAHYRRCALVYAPCCNAFFPCRYCHNEAVNGSHLLEPGDVDTVLCLPCLEARFTALVERFSAGPADTADSPTAQCNGAGRGKFVFSSSAGPRRPLLAAGPPPPTASDSSGSANASRDDGTRAGAGSGGCFSFCFASRGESRACGCCAQRPRGLGASVHSDQSPAAAAAGPAALHPRASVGEPRPAQVLTAGRGVSRLGGPARSSLVAGEAGGGARAGAAAGVGSSSYALYPLAMRAGAEAPARARDDDGVSCYSFDPQGPAATAVFTDFCAPALSAAHDALLTYFQAADAANKLFPAPFAPNAAGPPAGVVAAQVASLSPPPSPTIAVRPCPWPLTAPACAQTTALLTPSLLAALRVSPQPVAAACRDCAAPFGRYACLPCRLFDDEPGRVITHCEHCGICRRGAPQDMSHCHSCNICFYIVRDRATGAVTRAHDDAACVPNALSGSCAVCCESFSETRRAVHRLRCGHVLHQSCFRKATASGASQCPVCKRSTLLSEPALLWLEIDRYLARTQMPAQWEGWRATVLCNDCLQHCETAYHFVYMRCTRCRGFNTSLQRKLPPQQPQQQPQQMTLAAFTQASAAAGVAAAVGASAVRALAQQPPALAAPASAGATTPGENDERPAPVPAAAPDVMINATAAFGGGVRRPQAQSPPALALTPTPTHAGAGAGASPRPGEGVWVRSGSALGMSLELQMETLEASAAAGRRASGSSASGADGTGWGGRRRMRDHDQEEETEEKKGE